MHADVLGAIQETPDVDITNCVAQAAVEEDEEEADKPNEVEEEDEAPLVDSQESGDASMENASLMPLSSTDGGNPVDDWKTKPVPCALEVFYPTSLGWFELEVPDDGNCGWAITAAAAAASQPDMPCSMKDVVEYLQSTVTQHSLQAAISDLRNAYMDGDSERVTAVAEQCAAWEALIKDGNSTQAVNEYRAALPTFYCSIPQMLSCGDHFGFLPVFVNTEFRGFNATTSGTVFPHNIPVGSISVPCCEGPLTRLSIGSAQIQTLRRRRLLFVASKHGNHFNVLARVQQSQRQLLHGYFDLLLATKVVLREAMDVELCSLLRSLLPAPSAADIAARHVRHVPQRRLLRKRAHSPEQDLLADKTL